MERTKEQLLAERGSAILVLKRLCEKYGDLDWDETLHMADILEKHLERPLDRRFEGQ